MRRVNELNQGFVDHGGGGVNVEFGDGLFQRGWQSLEVSGLLC